MDANYYTRRDFLRHLTVFGAAWLLPPTATQAAGALVSVGRVADFPTGTFRAVTLPGNRLIYVRRLPGRQPTFLTLSAACTHKGCPVAWNPADHRFHCPCHRGLYDAQGRNIGGPPPRPLSALPARVVRGLLYVKA